MVQKVIKTKVDKGEVRSHASYKQVKLFQKTFGTYKLKCGFDLFSLECLNLYFKMVFKRGIRQ